MLLRRTGIIFGALLFGAVVTGSGAESGRVVLPGHMPAVVSRLTPKGRLATTNTLSLAIGLPLRNKAGLDELLRQLYDPAGTNFHKFLTSAELTGRFGPTEADYQAVIQFAETNGLMVTYRHGNRVVLDVEGSAANVEQAFHIVLRTYRHPVEARDFFAPDTEPSVPVNLPVVDIGGLNDYSPPRPLAHKVDALKSRPLSFSGPVPHGEYAGNDFRNAYVPGTMLTGAGQKVGLLEFSAYYPLDVTNYENIIGLTNYVPLTTVTVGSRSPSTANNDEVALDIETAIAMAPGLSGVIVYEERSVNPSSLLNRMASDNLAKQLSSSWTWSGGPNTTIDGIFATMAAQGQSFFQASGDDDAYTGQQLLDNSGQSTAPVDSTNLTTVGGTTLTMSGTGASWSSETVWNYNLNNIPNLGSGGGISAHYTIPWWQTNVSMAANQGSTTFRNVPDVALTADNIFVSYDNGDDSGTNYFMGTSCAAPLWAGFCALVNQQAIATGGTNVGFLNPALYAIANSTNYNACFHDIITGNNVGNNTAGLFSATASYDLCTGLGTPNGTNLINALVVRTPPAFITPPANQTVTNGANIAFSATVSGNSPLAYQWRSNVTNLVNGGNVSGVTSNVLSFTAVTTNNAGNYSLIVTNNYGSATSSVVTLTVTFPPSFTLQPTIQTIVTGSNAVFNATVSGNSPLAYQWRRSGTNLVNGGNVSGVASNVLTFTAVTTNNAGNYSLIVTNNYGSATSSVATLTVTVPPAFTFPTTNLTVQCGSNAAFAITAAGTPPLSYQWRLDNAAIAGATNSSLSLTNVHLPNHTVAVVVTNLEGSASNSVTLAVQDTLPPVIMMNGGNPDAVELEGVFVDPGATAYDGCAGVVSVTASGVVNPDAVGTNAILYTASDGNGNTNTATRTVIVRDTTPPAIVWSITNLVLAADTNCGAALPDVTGTNYILATELSLPLTITQAPTNGTRLPLGSNAVVFTVQDAYGNAAYSTNIVIVQDQTPPVILTLPQSQTNNIGANINFSVAATACTPLAFQWVFNNAMLADQTNSTLILSNITAAATGDYFAVAGADGGFTTSSVATLTVTLASPSLALASSENPSGFRDSVSFTADLVPATATGSVQFLTNGAAFDIEPLVAGTAVSTNISSIPRGTNVIAAVYSGDSSNLPATNTLAQIVTNHPPVATAAFYSRLAGYPLAIAVADLATNWSDPDGDAVSLAAIGVSTNGVTVSNNAGTLVYFKTNDVADEFFVTITDGWGGTNYQPVNLSTVLTDTVPSITAVMEGTNGSVTLTLGGAPDRTYVLEATTNLLAPNSWLPLTTNMPGTNGIWQFTDLEITGISYRFYRLLLLP